MKKSGQCPKCGSQAIYTNEKLTKRGERATIPITTWKSYFTSVYACTDCGYFEEYIAETELQDAKRMELITQHWEKYVP